MFDAGKTCPECLYDFAVLLSSAESVCIDQDSELWKVYHQMVNAVWSQLPEKIVVEFGSE